MKKQNRLLLARSIFFSIVTIIFAMIIISEKAGDIFLPTVQKKINTYLENNYSSIKDGISIKKISYNNREYKAKVISSKNKNHYFYIYYKNHNLKDTYQKDYVEGKSLLSHIKKELETEITSETNQSCNITILATLNNYTEQVKERIIEEDNLTQLKFYSIEKEITIDNWTPQNIMQSIITTINSFQKENISPKYYTIIITNKKDITTSIKIENLSENFSKNLQKEQIINDIINDNNSQLLKQNKITYQYLN